MVQSQPAIAIRRLLKRLLSHIMEKDNVLQNIKTAKHASILISRHTYCFLIFQHIVCKCEKIGGTYRKVNFSDFAKLCRPVLTCIFTYVEIYTHC